MINLMLYNPKRYNNDEARRLLRQGVPLELVTRDATGNHWISHVVWLDEEGDIVYSHPTNPAQGPCRVPRDSTFRYHEGRSPADRDD